MFRSLGAARVWWSRDLAGPLSSLDASRICYAFLSDSASLWSFIDKLETHFRNLCGKGC